MSGFTAVASANPDSETPLWFGAMDVRRTWLADLLTCIAELLYSGTKAARVWPMVEGVLIAESLRVGTTLVDLCLTVRKLTRWHVSDTTRDQPDIWTIIEFTADETDPDMLAGQFAVVLDSPGWYVDFHTKVDKYVVFPGKVLRYPRGDAHGRDEVVAYGRSVGVPESQLDWGA